MSLFGAIVQIIVFLLGGALGYFLYSIIFRRDVKEYSEKIAKSEKIATEIINKSEQKLREAEHKAKQIILDANRDIDRRNQKIDQMEQKLQQKEEKLEQKMEGIEQEKQGYIDKKTELNKVVEQQKSKLSEISNLTPEQAKNALFEQVEKDEKDEIVKFVEKFKTIKKEEADKESQEILSKVLPRISMNSVSEFTITSVELASEDIKGKLIGREGRNVSYFEKITGVEVLIDDTPLLVKLSSYDNEKRFLATETLKRLMKDGRINPVYIEKTYNEVAGSLEELLIEKGKEALSILNLPFTKPDIMRMIGQFHLRYSYGQNLWIHSIEVARMAEAIAVEMGMDGLLAKKAGLLHDIGKVVAANGQSHTKVGGEVLRKYGFDPVIINTAEGHHYDIPLTHPIGRIVTAADAISAGRPGARFNTKAFFMEKMTELEKLISGVDGVDKVHIMQAGREIMIFVNPSLVDDLNIQKLIKEVAVRVEDQLDYPGIIRVVAIRETKVIDYLR